MLRRGFSPIPLVHLRDTGQAEDSYVIRTNILMISSFTFNYKSVKRLPLFRCLGTCISVLGLGMALCMDITPNKGSGAPSASSRRARASGKSRASLRQETGGPAFIFVFVSADKCVKCWAPVLTCLGHPYQFSGTASVSPAGPRRTGAPLEGHRVKNQCTCLRNSFPPAR